MSKLSVTIITLNEEYNIAKCIESVAGIADEIIVVDSGSKDRTGEIAESLGAKFIYNDWPGHQEQKNVAIDQTSNEWVLSLDADEWIDEPLANEIVAAIENDDIDGYQIDRKTMFLGEYVTVWSPDWIYRLFKKSHGRFGGVNPHDVVIMKPGSSTARLRNQFYHNSYRSLDQYFARMNSYTTIGARALYKKGKKFRFHKLLLSPWWMFFKKVFFKGAVFDGFRGFLISFASVYYVFMKYAKLWELEQRGLDEVPSDGVGAEHSSRAS